MGENINFEEPQGNKGIVNDVLILLIQARYHEYIFLSLFFYACHVPALSFDEILFKNT